MRWQNIMLSSTDEGERETSKTERDFTVIKFAYRAAATYMI